MGVPEKRGKRGRPRPRLHGRSRQRPHAVRALAGDPQPVWPQVVVRPTERGRLAAACAVQRVWTVAGGQRPRAAGWGIRRDAEGDGSSTRLKAPEDAPHERLIAWSCRRSCIARPLEDAQTAIGWDACQAQPYRAGEHPLALTAASLGCVAQPKWAWAQA